MENLDHLHVNTAMIVLNILNGFFNILLHLNGFTSSLMYFILTQKKHNRKKKTKKNSDFYFPKNVNN